MEVSSHPIHPIHNSVHGGKSYTTYISSPVVTTKQERTEDTLHIFVFREGVFQLRHHTPLLKFGDYVYLLSMNLISGQKGRYYKMF